MCRSRTPIAVADAGSEFLSGTGSVGCHATRFRAISALTGYRYAAIAWTAFTGVRTQGGFGRRSPVAQLEGWVPAGWWELAERTRPTAPW